VSTGFRNTLALILFVVVVIWAIASAKAEGASRPRNTRAICEVFGRYCDQALRVSWCESHWLTTARNGEHLGLFQLGATERHTFGHGPDALSQARAAFRYFNASGKDWSPWSCQP